MSYGDEMNDQQAMQPQPPPAASSVTTTAAPAGRLSEIGAAGLTLVLWALLVDAAVETFLSGAPVRWWVAGIVAAYLGLAAVVWRASGDRFGWSRRATASLFVLLGVLALSAWMPDGLTHGVRMLKQPAGIVLLGRECTRRRHRRFVARAREVSALVGPRGFGFLALYVSRPSRSA